MDELINDTWCPKIDGMTLEEYFELHPEEEEEFIEEMERLHFYDEVIDYPEDWVA